MGTKPMLFPSDIKAFNQLAGDFEVIATVDEQSKGAGTSESTASYAIYAVALAVSISIWFLAIRAPLWLDETSGYWWVKDGFSQIWSRQTLDPPAYYYILWLSTKILGTSEIALRTPSVLAMLGAVCLLYLAARELFDRDVAIIAVILFCIHPIVVFASVDVRPYAFGVLAVNASLVLLLKLRHDDSNRMAALFGLSAASMLYFHYLLGAILPALLICFFIVKPSSGKALWRQLGIATAVFAVALLPLIPGLRYMFQNPRIHVFEAKPPVAALIQTIVPSLGTLLLYMATIVTALALAGLAPRRKEAGKFDGWRILFCICVGFIPLLLLYGVSVTTSLHMFATRHQIEAIPGIALCWAYVVSGVRVRALRLLICILLVANTAYAYFRSSDLGRHQNTWKYALAVAEQNAAQDDAPVLICSDFPESDYVAMPVGSAKESRYFAQLSYYKLTVPVVPLPRSLNGEAMGVGSQFLAEAEQKHERFLALGSSSSFATLNWLAGKTSATYVVRKLGIYDEVEVLEFTPREQAKTLVQN